MEDELPETAPPSAPRTTPGPMLRFLVVISGLFTLGMGRAVERTGGAAALIIGLIMQVVGVLVVAIAIGAVEWLVRRMRRTEH